MFAFLCIFSLVYLESCTHCPVKSTALALTRPLQIIKVNSRVSGKKNIFTKACERSNILIKSSFWDLVDSNWKNLRYDFATEVKWENHRYLKQNLFSTSPTCNGSSEIWNEIGKWTYWNIESGWKENYVKYEMVLNGRHFDGKWYWWCDWIWGMQMRKAEGKIGKIQKNPPGTEFWHQNHLNMNVT